MSTAGKLSETLIVFIVFTVRDNDTLDTCYRHLNPPSKVVACYAWKRQK